MENIFDYSSPLYMQVKEKIEALILKGDIQDGEKLPSTSEMVHYYKLNHLTIAKGVQCLVDEGIVYKKKGSGTFLQQGGREKLLRKKQERFEAHYIRPLLEEAKRLNLDSETVIDWIRRTKEREMNE